MGRLRKVLKLIRNPYLLVSFLGLKGKLKWLPDNIYIMLVYKARVGGKIDLKNPQTFNQKLQWLKLYNRNPLYTNLVDKYEVRSYVANIIGESHLIPLIGVWDTFEDIDFSNLPNQFVLKATHDSGGVVICKDKKSFDYKAANKLLNNSLKTNYFYAGREWPYKNIKSKIICEKLMLDQSGVELKDYKIMCFEGVPKIIQVISERTNNSYLINYFDLDWKEISIPRKNIKRNNKIPEIPNNLKKMIEISRKLSKNIPFVRIDLYDINDKVFFGEFTFFPVSGFMTFENKKDDDLLGKWITLPKNI